MNRLALSAMALSGSTPSQKDPIQISGPTDGVLLITLDNHSSLNALTSVMRQHIIIALKSVSSKPDVKCIVIRSSHQKIFCAGADIKEFVNKGYEHFLREELFETLQEAFRLVKVPLVAAVDGKAFGGGFQLALLCDVIVCSEKAEFGLPETNLGLIPGIGGTQRLTRIVGEKAAMSMILTAQTVSGKKAADLGIATLLGGPNFEQETINFAKRISSRATATLIAAKRAIRFASNSTLEEGLNFERAIFYPLFSTQAAKEGINAFVSKRKADFTGK